MNRFHHSHKPMPPLMRNTLWMVSTHLLRLSLRLAYFVMLTRGIGSDAFLAGALWSVIGIRYGMQDERKAS